MSKNGFSVRSAVLRAVAVALALSFCVGASAQDTCESEGVEFGFFNGVDTEEDFAQKVVEEFLPPLYGPTTPKGQPITYTLYYNDTEGLSDFVEVFEQRLLEHVDLLGGRFELFFEATRGGGNWWGALTQAIPATRDVLTGLGNTFLATVARGLAERFLAPPATHAIVSQRHRAQIDHAVGLGRKMLLFAHSQGNLFVNAAHDHALATSDADSVRVVHVAPASPRLTGVHTLADLDVVINGLFAAGLVPPNTDQIPGYLLRPPGLSGRKDFLGHGLLEIYLNPALSTAGRIRSQVEAALRALDSAPKKPLPPYPDFVETPWNGGEEPAYVAMPFGYSHRLDSVVFSYSVPEQWKYVEDNVRGVWGRVLRQYEVEQHMTLQQVGKGFGGTMRCSRLWGPVDEGEEPFMITRCSLQRFLESYSVSSTVPQELQALGRPKSGTTVSLGKETYPVGRVFAMLTGTEKVRFTSGSFEVSLGPYRGLNYQNESAWTLPGANNEAEIRAWRVKRNAFLAEEDRRYGRYIEARTEYERRRQACEAASIPAPAPAPAVIRSPFLGLGECVLTDVGSLGCPV